MSSGEDVRSQVSTTGIRAPDSRWRAASECITPDTWLPTYLVKERHMGLLQMGFMASMPLTGIRKTFLIVGLLMASCIGFAAFAESAVLAVVLLCIAKSGTTVAASQVWALPGDVAPRNMTSMVAGVQNSVSNMGGVLGPIVTDAIVGATGSFTYALLFLAALIVVAILNYLFLLGKVERIQADEAEPAGMPAMAK